jgi:maleate isomerase
VRGEGNPRVSEKKSRRSKSMTNNRKIGLIVPSSNTTMETEIPAMLRRRESLFSEETFTFHSSRTRMRQVSGEELNEMVRDSDRCAAELSDAGMEVMAYACLIAVMSQGPGYHTTSEERLAKVAEENGAPAPVVSSAGALVRGLKALGASKVAIVAPYMKPLTQTVIDYLQDCGIQVTDSVSLEVPDNLEVARLDPANLPSLASRLDHGEAEAVILSACVQMPSLSVIQETEDRHGLPMVSAATATTYEILTQLGLDPIVPEAGHLLSGKFSGAAARR